MKKKTSTAVPQENLPAWKQDPATRKKAVRAAGKKKKHKDTEKQDTDTVKDTVNRHLGLKIGLAVTAVVILTAVIGFNYIKDNYTVTQVSIEGNLHYTNEEIMDMVMTGPLGHNSLYLRAKYRNQEIEGIPFVAAMEVEILDKDAVRIRVYEKKLAGYVSYLGRCMYFDKDGVIVETSTIKTSGVPEVTGLSFDHVVKYEKLPVENDAVFNQILDITQSLSKYDLHADKIFFTHSYEAVLYFDRIRVEIGDLSNIDMKFSRLKTILPELSGLSGVLDMENVTADTKITPFTVDKK